VPRGDYTNTEARAVEIVSDSERARGFQPSDLLSQRAQHDEGCDLLSVPESGGPAHRIEIKGWGEPLLKPGGSFAYPADVNQEQLERARTDPTWRLEIVGNIAAERAGTGNAERLTLSGAEVVERAITWRFRIPLDGLSERVVDVVAKGDSPDVAKP
jgi:hypothetical protein